MTSVSFSGFLVHTGVVPEYGFVLSKGGGEAMGLVRGFMVRKGDVCG